MQVHIDVAGVPSELEMRISLACRLLAAYQVQVDMQAWNGRLCDVVIVDMQSEPGRVAYEVASRRSLPILRFGIEAPAQATPGMFQLDRHAPVAAIVRALREMLLPSAATEEEAVSGFLGVCLRETGCTSDLQVNHGQVSVMLRPAAGRIHARSVSDLLAVEAWLLNPGWFSTLASEPNWEDAGWHVSRSLDGFLLIACRRFHGRLPILEHRAFKLDRWPDLGSMPEDMDSLRLAALLHRSAWTVRDLAQHADIDIAWVNAFCWATLACGALSVVEPVVLDASPRQTHAPAPGMLQRIARHFGMRFGHGPFRV
ncbi:MAG: hypothetical protein WBW32_10280 [Luteibacter sp.]